jgi:DNA-binding SARP family transcriptional activator
VEFRLLGSMELIVEGRQVKLGSPKERTLLAILLCAARAPVPMDTLLDRLWDGDPPPSGSVTVQSYLSRLRHRLRAEVGDLVRLNSSTRAWLCRWRNLSRSTVSALTSSR